MIAEFGFAVADISGITKFKPLVLWGRNSGGHDTGHEKNYYGYQAIYIGFIVQLVLVFVVPIAGPIIGAIVLISTFIGNTTWAVPYFEEIEDHYRLPYTPPDMIRGQDIDAIQEWTEVDTCLYHMIDSAMCTYAVSMSVTKARLIDIMDLVGFTSRDEFAEIVMAVATGKFSFSSMKPSLQDSNRTITITGSHPWDMLETYLEKLIEETSSTVELCLGNSRGTMFQYLLYMKLVGEKNPELAVRYPTWAAAYDTMGDKLCKKPLAAQRTFLWFAVIGFVGLIVMSGIGCCYCPSLDEKLTVNVNVPGANFANGSSSKGTDKDNETLSA